MSRRPVIGITAYEEEAAFCGWVERAAIVPIDYVRSVEKAGGLPLVIPVQSLSTDDIDSLFERIDGLVLCGGPDVDPARYGALPHHTTSEPRTSRDETELQLVKAACDRELPTLAICRGVQLLNVARGGTLHQHLPDVVSNDSHSPTPGVFGRHRLHIDAKSQLAKVLDCEFVEVPTHHHQAIAEIGEGLVPTAWTDDGTIEGVEDPALPHLLGVQWHPEAGNDLSLFQWLEEATNFGKDKGGA